MFFHMLRVDYPSGWEKLKRLDFEKLAKLKKEKYYVDIEWVLGSFGTFPGQGYLVSFNTPHFKKYPGLGNFDFIRSYLPYARKYGMKLVSYLNLHWFSYDFGKEHPEWQQITFDGIPYGRKYPLYGNGTTFCINSPWRDWAFKMIEEVMKTGIDGVFLDGPVIFPESCYCKYCKDLFKKQTGKELPEWENWDDPVWKDFLLFRKYSFIEFMKGAKEAVKKVNKNGFVFINSSYLPSWIIPRYIGDLEPFQDFNLAEAFYHLGSTKDNFFYYFVSKCLKVSEKPSTAAMHHAAGVWHWIPLYEMEVKMSIAQNLCVQNGLWTAVINGNDIEDKEYWGPIKDMLQKIEGKKEIFNKGKTYSPVGLYVSSLTQYFYISNLEEIYGEKAVEKEENLVFIKEKERRKKKKNLCDEIFFKEFSGFFEILTRSHIPFRIVNKQILKKALEEINLFILPNSACLSDEEISLIKRFVEKGGKLIITFESGWYDEMGEKRNQNPLLDSEIEGTFPLTTADQYCITEKEMAGYKKNRLIPRPAYSLKIKYKGEKILSFIKPSEGLYSYSVEKSDYPAIIKTKKGKGEIIYFPLLAGEFYYSMKVPEWERIISTMIKEELNLKFKVESPSTVITEFYKDGKDWIIHIVNSTGDMKRPFSSIIPVDVKIEINGKYTLSDKIFEDGVVEVKKKGGRTEIKIRNLCFYEVLILEKGG